MTENSKFLLSLIPEIKSIFTELTGYNDTPEHMEFMIDSVIAGQFLYFSGNFWHGNFLDDITKYEVVEAIYNTNFQKIKNVNFNTLQNAAMLVHLDEFVIQDMMKNYSKLNSDKNFAMAVILNTMKNSELELRNYLSSQKAHYSGNGKIKLPVDFYINCFVHPIVILNRDWILHQYQDDIDEQCESLYSKFYGRYVDFINGILGTIRKAR